MLFALKLRCDLVGVHEGPTVHILLLAAFCIPLLASLCIPLPASHRIPPPTSHHVPLPTSPFIPEWPRCRGAWTTAACVLSQACPGPPGSTLQTRGQELLREPRGQSRSPNLASSLRMPPRWTSWSCLDGAGEQQAASGFAGRRGWVCLRGGLAPAPPHLGAPVSSPPRGAESREVTPGALGASRALLGPAKPLPSSSCPGILAVLAGPLRRAVAMSREMLQVTSAQRGTGRRTPPQPALYSVGSTRLRLGHRSA